MGGIVSKVGQGLGLVADPDAGRASANTAMDLQARAVRELEKLDVPTIEAQKIVLQHPELVATLVPETVQDTELADIQLDPQFRDKQLEGLAALEEMAAQGGFTPEMLARFEALRRQSAGDEQARQASIQQSFAERGAEIPAGAELQARLASAQQATQRDAEASKDMLMQAPSARMQAIQQMGQMSGSMRDQDYQQALQQASAQDAINRFNTQLRNQAQEYNVGNQQRLAEKRTSLANEQETYNKGLIQQDFNNRFKRATGMTSQLQNQAQGFLNKAKSEAAGEQQRAAGTMDLVKTGAGFFVKDGGVKYANGGIDRGMAYEDGGEGTIIDSGMNSYSGDLLEDRINDGEAVLNIEQQDNIKKLLKGEPARTDERLDAGLAEVNPDAQEELMAVARGQMSPEEMSDKPVVEDKKTKMQVLEELLEALR